jgi:hypothetical protein
VSGSVLDSDLNHFKCTTCVRYKVLSSALSTLIFLWTIQLSYTAYTTCWCNDLCVALSDYLCNTTCWRPGCNLTTFRVGQNRRSAPYMTVCMVISLLKIPHVHRICL